MKRGFLLRYGERAFLAAGLLLVGLTGLGVLRPYALQHWPDVVTSLSNEKQPSSLTGFRNAYLLRPIFNPSTVPFRIAGHLEVPRLGISVLVVDGEEEEALALAAAHISGTAALGTRGNTVIAAHRDTVFWPLRNVRLGDSIRVKTSATFAYTVKSIRIVMPDDTSVLNDRGGSQLTLITCYPFRYIGNAPKRYVVEAELRSPPARVAPASAKFD